MGPPEHTCQRLGTWQVGRPAGGSRDVALCVDWGSSRIKVCPHLINRGSAVAPLGLLVTVDGRVNGWVGPGSPHSRTDNPSLPVLAARHIDRICWRCCLLAGAPSSLRMERMERERRTGCNG
jgi:hypothetical protein